MFKQIRINDTMGKDSYTKFYLDKYWDKFMFNFENIQYNTVYRY
jgi:hypothetical protein